MPVQFETRESCPVCHSTEATRLVELGFDDPQLHSFLDKFYHSRVGLTEFGAEKYCVDQCASCSMVYQATILDPGGMAQLYGDWVDQRQSLQKKQNANTKLKKQYTGQIQSMIGLIRKPASAITFLEFGMGWGYWSHRAQQLGINVDGYELSTERGNYAASMGVHLIAELPEPGPHYDGIYANQVFEHLPDPLSVLLQLAALLKPKGIVYIRVPDGRGVGKQLKQSGWSSELDAIHPLEHINCFTRGSLILLGVKAGLTPVNAPLRLNWGRLGGGLKREFSDRFLNTHLFFRRNHDASN